MTRITSLGIWFPVAQMEEATEKQACWLAGESLSTLENISMDIIAWAMWSDLHVIINEKENPSRFSSMYCFSLDSIDDTLFMSLLRKRVETFRMIVGSSSSCSFLSSFSLWRRLSDIFRSCIGTICSSLGSSLWATWIFWNSWKGTGGSSERQWMGSRLSSDSMTDSGMVMWYIGDSVESGLCVSYFMSLQG